MFFKKNDYVSVLKNDNVINLIINYPNNNDTNKNISYDLYSVKGLVKRGFFFNNNITKTNTNTNNNVKLMIELENNKIYFLKIIHKDQDEIVTFIDTNNLNLYNNDIKETKEENIINNDNNSNIKMEINKTKKIKKIIDLTNNNEDENINNIDNINIEDYDIDDDDKEDCSSVNSDDIDLSETQKNLKWLLFKHNVLNRNKYNSECESDNLNTDGDNGEECSDYELENT